MKNILSSIAFGALLFVVTGCHKYQEDTPETLEVSTKTLDAPAEGKTFVVKIQSSSGKWEAMSESSWISTFNDGSELKIMTESNNAPLGRQALVKVIAPGIVREITVSQAGVAACADFHPSEMTVDQYGGDFFFYVTSNTPAWTVKSDAEWVNAVANYSKRRVDLSVTTNESTALREATITVFDGAVGLGTFRLVQEGVQLFILPFTEFLSNPYEVEAYEKSRHSMLVKIPDGFVNSSTYGFKTLSPLFPSVEYIFANNQYIEAKLYPAHNETITDDVQKSELIDFLKSKDFLFDFGNIYVQPDINMEVTLTPPKNGRPAHLYFRFLPEQPEGMPVFTEFPYGCLDFQPGDEDKIYAYEKTHGGTYVPELSKPNELYFKTKSPALSRTYYLGDQSVQAFDDYRYAFFFYKGTPFLTREFRKTLAEEGFVMTDKVDFINLYKYKNDDKKITLDVWIRDEKVGDEKKQIIRFNIHKTA